MKLKPLLIALAAGAIASAPQVFAAGQYGSQSGGSMQQSQAQDQEKAQAVKKVQQSLNDKGYDSGPVDGILGQKTRGALEEFQQSEGMQASGDINRETIDALGLDPEASEFSAFVEDQDSGAMQQDGGAMQDGGGMQQDGGMMQDDSGMQQSPGVDTRENGMGSPGTP